VAVRISEISSATEFHFPDLMNPIFTTISSSSAPFRTASIASYIFTRDRVMPVGNPITVEILT
jgi:hypothetical protein